MRGWTVGVALALVAGCGDGASNTPPVDEGMQGLNSLYMGHSYFRRQAEAMETYAELAGVDGHSSESFFRGGYDGSAYAIWDDPASQATIKGFLDAGDIEMFGMTIFVEDDAPEGNGRTVAKQLEGLRLWIDYAREQNPETEFFVGLPWLRGPLTFVGETGDPETSGYVEYGEATADSEAAAAFLVDELRAEFVDSDLFLLAYGQGAVELRTRYNQGNLPDVDALVSGGGKLGIHSDTHGHAEQMLTDLNTLVWVASIYGVDPNDIETDVSYTTDIHAIAHEVWRAQDPAYIRGSE